jgi:SAM-dependent methyltransferase/uncharacterized protein YbaR (Trm112 family)
MKTSLLDYLVCPVSGSKLELEISERDGDEILEGSLVSTSGQRYPIRRGIPRFVSSEIYTNTFGFQWNRHARIYFDNKDRFRIYSTQDQLQQKLGLSSDKVKGCLVLDAGCGTGANGAAIAEWGAREVFCVDLSSAVEAAYANTRHFGNVHVIQADLFTLPFRHESFDILYSIGVLMATPNTKKAFFSLVPFVKEDGVIATWVYVDTPDLTQRLSDRLRALTTKMNPRLLYALCWLTVPAYYVYKIPFLGKALFHFLPPLSTEPYWEDRVLDTFDWYSPTYQWKHTYPEVYSWFQEATLTDIHLMRFPVSVWGRKPVTAHDGFHQRQMPISADNPINSIFSKMESR